MHIWENKKVYITITRLNVNFFEKDDWSKFKSNFIRDSFP